MTSNRILGRAALAIALGLWVVASPRVAAATEPVAEFGDNPGNLAMYLYRPADAAPGLPLVVALHGCTQSATVFDDETGLVALNPPYGRRLGSPGQAADLFQRIFSKLVRDFSGWRFVVIIPRELSAPAPEFCRAALSLTHGGLPVKILRGQIP